MCLHMCTCLLLHAHVQMSVACSEEEELDDEEIERRRAMIRDRARRKALEEVSPSS